MRLAALPPHPVPASAALRTRAAVVLAAAVLVGCGPAAGTFSPAGACVTDGRGAGAYPDLEALVPQAIGGKAATVDSGRNCSDKALGTLTSHEVHEVRFAGATVDEGQGNGTVVAIFEAADGQPSLSSDWIDEFYLAGALQSGKTDNTTTTHPTMGEFRTVRPPVSFDGQRSLSVLPPPTLGEHNGEIDAMLRQRSAA